MDEQYWNKTGMVGTEECDSCGEYTNVSQVLLHADGECRDEWVCAECLGEVSDG
jgi:hypothetical protein